MPGRGGVQSGPWRARSLGSVCANAVIPNQGGVPTICWIAAGGTRANAADVDAIWALVACGERRADDATQVGAGDGRETLWVGKMASRN